MKANTTKTNSMKQNKKASIDHIVVEAADQTESVQQQLPLTSEQKSSAFYENVDQEEDELKLERKSSAEQIITESSQLSQDEEDQYQSERKRSSAEQITIESPKTPEEEEKYPHKQLLQSESTSEKTPEDILEHEDEYELKRSPSADKVDIELRDQSEREDDEEQQEQDVLESSQKIEEEEQTTKQILIEPTETIERQEEQAPSYERPLSSGQVALSFSQQQEEDLEKEQFQHELERNTSAEEMTPSIPEKLQYPYESTQSQGESFNIEAFQDYEREISDENFLQLQSSSFHEEEEEEDNNEPLKRPEEWTRSAFQREEIYGDKYRSSKYSPQSPELQTQLSSGNEKSSNDQSPVTSRVQRSNIISRTIPSYPDEEEIEEQDENEFRPTHLDISIPNDEPHKQLGAEIDLSPSDESFIDKDDQYEKLLYETSINIVDQILDDAVRETIEQEDILLNRVATDIVNDVIDNIYTKYDDEIMSSQREEATSADVSTSDLTDWSALVQNVPDVTISEKPTTATSSGSDHGEEEEEEEKSKDESLLSDDEEKEKTDPQVSDQPYLSVSDALTSRSTEELVQELRTLEEQINENADIIRSSSPSASSSISDNDDIHHYDLQASQTSANEFKETTEQLDDHSQEQQQTEIPQSPDMDTLSRDIMRYRSDSQTISLDNYSHRIERRPSSPPTSPLLKQDFVQITCSSMSDVDEVQQQLQDEQEENKLLQEMIDTIIQQAQEIVQSDVSFMIRNFQLLMMIFCLGFKHPTNHNEIDSNYCC